MGGEVQGRKGRVKGKRMEVCSGCCDDPANSPLSCVNTLSIYIYI